MSSLFTYVNRDGVKYFPRPGDYCEQPYTLQNIIDRLGRAIVAYLNKPKTTT